MNSRSFIIGLICGATLGAIAGWFLGVERAKDVPTISERETNSSIAPNVVGVAPTVSNNTQERVIDTDQETSDSQTSSDISIDPAVAWPANLRTELALEPKDDSWAYYMEQTLLQFLGSHSSMAQFSISSIECRTTKCLVEVTGYDESTVPVWDQVMYDIRQQSWNEFGQYGTSSGNIDGRVTIIGTLQRATGQE